ncbi:hypothetical protein B9J89_06260 [Vibrio sp. V15_P4S5T153]|nr:hypothetical protein CEG15_15960 [Vibrio anguillarum]OXX63863.1 hypothetical protein B9J89_06260 [Vibrio sp. V15_P4S5T153]
MQKRCLPQPKFHSDLSQREPLANQQQRKRPFSHNKTFCFIRLSELNFSKRVSQKDISIKTI